MDVERTAALACRAGCTVERKTRDASGTPHVFVTCGDGWQAARYLVGLAQDDVTDGAARRLRSMFGTVDDESFVRAAHAWVRDHIEFRREEGEIFQSPTMTVARGFGDCDCHARLLFGILAGRVPTRLAFLYRGDGRPRHVVVQAKVSGRWRWLETTVQRRQIGIDAAYGEPPLRAAARAGMTRPDLARGMRAFILGGPMDLATGATYRFRLGMTGASDVGAAARRALASAGFADAPITLWMVAKELPSDFPSALADELPNVTTVWGEAVFFAPSRDVALPTTFDGPVMLESVALWEDAPPPTRPSTPVPATMGGAAQVTTSHTAWLSDAFFRDLVAMAGRLGARPEWFLAFMNSESGLKPWAYNAGGGASGLSQMLPAILKGVGFEGTPQEFAAMSADAQLPYVERYFAPHRGQFASAATLYQVNFVPASLALGRSPGTIIVDSQGTGYGGQEAAFYRDNAGFDTQRKGYITVQDLQDAMDRAAARNAPVFDEAMARLAANGGVGLAGAVGVGLFLAGVGILGYTYLAPSDDTLRQAVMRLGGVLSRVIG